MGTSTPPPANFAYLRNRILQLKHEAEALNQSPRVAKITTQVIELHSQKITKWMESLPKSQQERKYSIDEIIRLANLNGLLEAIPARSDVAKALRSANFIQVRSWKKDDRNKRFWVWKHS